MPERTIALQGAGSSSPRTTASLSAPRSVPGRRPPARRGPARRGARAQQRGGDRARCRAAFAKSRTSAPARAALDAASSGAVSVAAIDRASRSSVITTPSNPIRSRSSRPTIALGQPGGRVGVERGVRGVADHHEVDPGRDRGLERLDARRERRSATRRRRSAAKSVLTLASPRPGKCFAVAATPPFWSPSANATPTSATTPGSSENARPEMNEPGAGTSSTGARSTLTPDWARYEAVASPSAEDAAASPSAPSCAGERFGGPRAGA